jgi:hypothetical protein
MDIRCMIPVIKSPKDYQAYRISPHDTNRLAIVFDPTMTDASLTFCVEIFDEVARLRLIAINLR